MISRDEVPRSRHAGRHEYRRINHRADRRHRYRAPFHDPDSHRWPIEIIIIRSIIARYLARIQMYRLRITYFLAIIDPSLVIRPSCARLVARINSFLPSFFPNFITSIFQIIHFNSSDFLAQVTLLKRHIEIVARNGKKGTYVITLLLYLQISNIILNIPLHRRDTVRGNWNRGEKLMDTIERFE